MEGEGDLTHDESGGAFNYVWRWKLELGFSFILFVVGVLGGEEAYPEKYDASSYANYTQQPQEGESTSYQQQQYDSYDGYSGQQKAQEAAPGYDVSYDYQYGYDASYESAAAGAGQDYGYYAVVEGLSVEQQTYAVEMPETWSYSPATDEGQQNYLDQLTTEQTGGYYYDEEGNLIDGYGGLESPTSVFNQEAYWQTEPIDNISYYDVQATPPDSAETTSLGTRQDSPQDATDTDGLILTESSPADTLTEGPNSVATSETSSKKANKSGKDGRTASPSRKKKSRKERIQKRQALLEKEEEEKLKAQESAEATEATDAVGTAASASIDGVKATAKTNKVLRKLTFVDREKAKFQLKIRIAKAIKRNRMPVQIRILTATRNHLTPMEKYFGNTSVECVLSDIFWASIKGDLGRVRHLVEVEGESATDSKLDPWGLHQTPLHWAAKGGSVLVVNYLLAVGASPRSLDENGSLPLHLSCWAGHVDASIVLLRSSDVKDLYVQDYDAAMCPLDWVNIRGHTKLLRAIEKYQDSLWLPKFVEDLIRGIVRYKIKIFKDLPKKPVAKGATDGTSAKPETSTPAEPSASGVDKTADTASENQPKDGAVTTTESATKKSLLKRATTEKNRKPARENNAASSKSLR